MKKNLLRRLHVKTFVQLLFFIILTLCLAPTTPSIEADSNGRINQNKGYNDYSLNVAALDTIRE